MGLHPARVARDAAQQRVLDLEREVDQFPTELHDIRKLGVKMTTQQFSLEKIAAEMSLCLKKAGLTKHELQMFCKAMSRLDEAERELKRLDTALQAVETKMSMEGRLAREEACQPPYELSGVPRRTRRNVASLAHRFTHLRGRWD
jgi:hypothetical protein